MDENMFKEFFEAVDGEKTDKTVNDILQTIDGFNYAEVTYVCSAILAGLLIGETDEYRQETFSTIYAMSKLMESSVVKEGEQ